MNRYCRCMGRDPAVWYAIHFSWALMLFMLLTALPARAAPASFTLDVVDHAGNAVSGFRWLIEEDTTYPVIPGVHTTDALSFSFHTSHNPVVKQGETTDSSAVIDGLDDTKRYFVSVLPTSAHNTDPTMPAFSNGGAQVSFTGTTVVVAQQPLPTAQISVFAYEDLQPINNMPDLPQELGLAGFDVKLFDPAGQYGMAGGRVFTDAFGNPLGTTYDATGGVITMGDGTITTGADGVVLIRNLAPGKYGVQITPPAGQNWVQTHTIEGSPTIDAWVKAGEPSYFTEFGPPGHHVFIGFVRSFDCFNNAAAAPAGYCGTDLTPGSSTISGTVVNQHISRPPDVAFYDAQPVSGCWIGLNSTAVGIGRGNYAMPCNADSSFTIPNVPPGSYNLVVWDKPLDIIFTTLPITVTAGSNVVLGNVSVFNWFHRLESTVFYDPNQNGFRDPGEPTLGADQASVNLRFRDGRIYDSVASDINGEAPFDEVFPFFHWLVAEVSFGTLKATGMTVTIDAGGGPTGGEALVPQPQFCTQADVDAGATCTVGAELTNPNTGDNLSRTETGPVLTQAFQGFLGQTNKIDWGKRNYAPGENGGISGVVLYAITRAENDPRYAVGEEWEPGIPRVQVNLYKDCDLDGKPDQPAATGCGALSSTGYVAQAPDVDNYPLDNFPGAEDVDQGTIGSFDQGDALHITHTDSFDDSRPTGCQGPAYTVGATTLDCFDGLRNFNQVRPGVFDGGYAFGGPDNPLAASTFIVEVAVPPGYELVKEEDKNVDFGDAYKPAPLLLPNLCVGEPHTIPQYLSIQTDAAGAPYPGIDVAELIESPFYNPTTPVSRPLCDRKQVRLSQGQNAAADFFLFTETPKAAMVVGGILNDVANEFDPNAPNFGEKFAPPWLPVSFRDWTGREIVRVYADENGKFNAMLPSTYSVHIPMPSGVSPNMITACMNDAGPIPNPINPAQMIIDPRYDRRYSQFCYTFQYMPGGTTYLDTPVLPIAAFAGAGNPLDCEQPTNTPLVHTVTRTGGNGPLVNVGEQLTITAVGIVTVPDPASPIAGATITRDYNFGAQGPGSSVTLNGIPLTIDSWSDSIITATVPAGASTGQLSIIRDDGIAAPGAVTVTVGPLPLGITAHFVQPDSTPSATPIQNAIDMAGPNDLILVAPGTYDELVIMYNPVRLQGWGAATVINARKVPAEKLQAWRNKVNTLYAARAFDILPGQPVPGFNVPNNEPTFMFDGEGAGITVLGRNSGPQRNRFRASNNARIDGFTITGADHGGAINVNGNASYLEISNNRLTANQGLFGGGIRVGHPDLTTTTTNGEVFTDANNSNLNIHNNEVLENGSLGGAGGGIALYTGTDNYRVNANYICGNFTSGNGGGIGHLGYSTGGRITSNALLFNQSFNQGVPVHGGGIAIAGQAPLVGTLLSPGSGRVAIDGNLIQGNQAGAGDGGGIALQQVNGSDVANSSNTNAWNRVDIFNNTVVNNVAGYAGGGVAMFDAVKVNMIHNTVAHNDSTATAGAAFTTPTQSDPQPAGIVSRANSTDLHNAMPPGGAFDRYREFSDPVLVNNIIWQNRSFYWTTELPPGGTVPTTFGLVLDTPAFKDLAVLGFAGGQLNPRSCLLTDTTGYGPSNTMGDPAFINGGFNGDRGQTVLQQELTTALQAQPALDEGGNFIEVRFGPLTPTGDYHLGVGSPAIDAGNSAIIGRAIELTVDYDGDTRPQGAGPDIGSDEVTP